MLMLPIRRRAVSLSFGEQLAAEGVATVALAAGCGSMVESRPDGSTRVGHHGDQLRLTPPCQSPCTGARCPFAMVLREDFTDPRHVTEVNIWRKSGRAPWSGTSPRERDRPDPWWRIKSLVNPSTPQRGRGHRSDAFCGQLFAGRRGRRHVAGSQHPALY